MLEGRLVHRWEKWVLLNNAGANPGAVTTPCPPKERKTNVDGPAVGGNSSCVKC